MKKFIICFVVLLFTSQMVWANSSLRVSVSECQPEKIASDMSKVLPCYLMRAEPDFRWVVKKKDTETCFIDNKQKKVVRYFLELTSLRWQQGEKGRVDFPLWQHRLTIYKPEIVAKDTALLYINGGTLHPDEGAKLPEQRDDLDFSHIAALTQSIVIDLKDVPNQYLRFAGGKPLKEDQLIAYTWSQFMMNPDKNYDWPLRLPMVKSVIKAMDAVQSQLKEEKIKVNQFVLSGASKRGWTAWLTTAMDTRVSAVIPLVANFVNLPDMIRHLFNVYKQGNPAIAPYMPLRAMVGTEPMDKLLSVIDPYQYRRLLTVPKFMVSASGDDFVPADTTQFFFHDLPGQKWMQVLPNSSHYIFREERGRASDIVESFYGVFIHGRKIPEINWKNDGGKLTVTSSVPPRTAKLWQATNPVARDFRKSRDNPDVSPFTSSPLKLKCRTECRFTVDLPTSEKGWKASFVELSFSNPPYKDLVFTTRLFVTPDRYQDVPKP